MNIFKKITKEEEKVEASEKASTSTPLPEPKEEWIWVEGYKGTNKDMKCRDFQFELGVQYDMPEDQEIVVCKNGFHLCLKQEHVYDYYQVGSGNRFFKVKALVRMSDVQQYGNANYVVYDGIKQFTGWYNDKLTSKSIIFLSELTRDEILKDTEVRDLPEEYKQMAINDGIEWAVTQYRINILVEDGYSLPFATYIAQNNKFETAHAFGSQKDLSIDMKVWGILSEGGIYK